MTRMWMLDPSCHCRKHLLGAHVETHMLLGSLKKGRKNFGKLETEGYIELRRLVEYHDALAAEMLRRGYRHESPMITDLELPDIGRVDPQRSIADLVARCPECAARIAVAV